MFVDSQHPTSFSYWPWCVLACGRRLAVYFFFSFALFGFGGTFLVQKYGKPNKECHLQEFAFPIFKGGLDKMAGLQVAAHGDLLLPLLYQLFIVFCIARKNLAYKG